MEIINKILWGVATSLIFVAGIYFSIKLNFLQINIKKIIKILFEKEKTNGISSKEALMMSLAGRIGVGSIAGISLAIYIGGVGSIFWIWIMTLLTAILSYSETILGIIYKEKDGNVYKGGPSYYIKNGLNKKSLGGIYAIIILISYIFGFISIQTNTITKSLNEIINLNPYIIGLILVILVILVIQKGVTSIAFISSKIVPIMTIGYLFLGLYIIFLNLNKIPFIILDIIKNAFNFKSFISGFLTSFIIGIQRGLFATEAGLGTGSIASSTTSNNNPYKQGFIQIFGVYITSFLICTVTAFIILTSDYINLDLFDINGIEIANYAFKYHLGNIGKNIIVISIFFFAFSTILTGYYYGESALKYFKNNINMELTILKIITLVMVFLGCIIPSNFIWSLVDIFVAILAIINIYALFNLRNDIFNETKIGLLKMRKEGKIK